jgi:hypothetical protein
LVCYEAPLKSQNTPELHAKIFVTWVTKLEFVRHLDDETKQRANLVLS